MRKLIRSLVPARLQIFRAMRSMLLAWDRAKADPPPARQRDVPPGRVAIVPADPASLVGSRGDEAMINALVGRLRAANARVEIAVLTLPGEAEGAARQIGLKPLPVWDRPLSEIVAEVRKFSPDAFVVIGADMMDGYYALSFSATCLILADVACGDGAATVVTGFSFNDRPAPQLRSVLERLRPGVHLNVRDPISYARFGRFSVAHAQPVADVAFLLQAEKNAASITDVTDWMRRRRDAGDRVLILNAHPMLFKNASVAQVASLVATFSSAIETVSERQAVSWLLLAHDFRGKGADAHCLQGIAERVGPSLAGRVLYPTSRFTAAQLKGIAAAADGVVTGRMHLAIAALGSGVPVACLTYQDKFQGLLQHFGLPNWLMMTPQAALETAGLVSMIDRFIAHLDPLTAQVGAALPRVLRLAEANLAPLLPDRIPAVAATSRNDD